LCDIAILVVDIMHGLEAQTVESINLLKKRRIPFVVALNKIDRIFQWKANPGRAFAETYKLQEESVRDEFEKRSAEILAEISGQGLNAIMYYKNTDFKKYVSVVPTSAATGEGNSYLDCAQHDTHRYSRFGTTFDLVDTKLFQTKALQVAC
jgi:translation initiation factor 5B